MTQPDDDFGEFLGRLLHQEADAVEPADDGLERIRARLTRPRPAPVAWVMAVFSGFGSRVAGAARSASVWLEPLRRGAPSRARWLRDGRAGKWRSPAVLAAAAVVAVAASVLALTPLPQQAVSGTAALWRSFGGAHGGAAGHGGGQAEGGSTAQPAPGASSSAPARQAHRHPLASPTMTVAPSPTPASESSAPASSSPAASPTPSSSSTACPSPSPSPSPGATSDPTSGACPSPTTSPTTGPTASPTPTPDPANQ